MCEKEIQLIAIICLFDFVCGTQNLVSSFDFQEGHLDNPAGRTTKQIWDRYTLVPNMVVSENYHTLHYNCMDGTAPLEIYGFQFEKPPNHATFTTNIIIILRSWETLWNPSSLWFLHFCSKPIVAQKDHTLQLLDTCRAYRTHWLGSSSPSLCIRGEDLNYQSPEATRSGRAQLTVFHWEVCEVVLATTSNSSDLGTGDWFFKGVLMGKWSQHTFNLGYDRE